MRKKQYPNYKKTDVEWLGEVPNHWDLCRLKYCATINDEVIPETTDSNCELTYVDIGNVDSNSGIVATETYLFEDAPSRARRIVRDGDVIVSTVRTYLRAITPIRKPESNLIVSTGFAVIRPRMIDPTFLSFALRSSYFIDTVVSRSNGVSYPAISSTEIGNIFIVKPSNDEQIVIGDYLEYSTTQIDKLIVKKQRQIDLLQEKRIALISQAVTKGLDPNVPMKDSGIGWLGEIPEHWEIIKLKFITYIRFSNVDKHTIDGEEDVSLCNYVDVYNNDFIINSLEFMNATATKDEIEKFTIKVGDIIITKDSESWTDIAVPAYVSEELDCVICGYHLALIRTITNTVDSRYLFRAFQSKTINYQFQILSTGITRYGLSNQGLINGLFLVPPLNEQIKIANLLDQEISRIDSLVEKIKNQLSY